MKKLAFFLPLMFVWTSINAQNKILCLKNNKKIEFTTECTDSVYFIITMSDDTCTITLNIPLKYYHESDSVTVKIRRKTPFDVGDKIHVSYCYSVGLHDIARYLDPSMFPVSTTCGDDLFYSVDLFYKDEKMWDFESIPSIMECSSKIKD